MNKALVYDITVANNHNYILADSGIVAHNCFNRSHAVAYSRLGYLCAWFKAHYPMEFFASLFSNRSGAQHQKWAPKAKAYANEAKLFDITVLPPDINKSDIRFVIESYEDKLLRYNFVGVKEVGAKAAKAIVQARGNKPFTDIYDFLFRVNKQIVNKKVFLALIACGAFDQLGYSRTELNAKADDIAQYMKDISKLKERKKENRQRSEYNQNIQPLLIRKAELKSKKKKDLSLEELEELEDLKNLKEKKLLEITEPTAPELNRSSKISLNIQEIIAQIDYTGIFFWGNPGKIIWNDTESIRSLIDNKNTNITGIVSDVRVFKDRRGGTMATFELADDTDNIKCLVFSSVYDKTKPINTGDLIVVSGVMETSRGRLFKAFGYSVYSGE